MTISGTWVNRHGSVLKLTEKNGALSGSYTTKVGTPDETKEFLLTGYSNGNLLGFVVSWEDHDSITAWIGRFEPQFDRIYTMWHVASKDGYRKNKATGVVEEVPRELWEAFLTQIDVFYRDNVVSSRKPAANHELGSGYYE